MDEKTENIPRLLPTGDPIFCFPVFLKMEQLNLLIIRQKPAFEKLINTWQCACFKNQVGFKEIIPDIKKNWPPLTPVIFKSMKSYTGSGY